MMLASSAMHLELTLCTSSTIQHQYNLFCSYFSWFIFLFRCQSRFAATIKTADTAKIHFSKCTFWRSPNWICGKTFDSNVDNRSFLRAQKLAAQSTFLMVVSLYLNSKNRQHYWLLLFSPHLINNCILHYLYLQLYNWTNYTFIKWSICK